MAATDPTIPQSWNRYAYVLNNPLALVDPSGMEECDVDGTCPITFTDDGDGGGDYYGDSGSSGWAQGAIDPKNSNGDCDGPCTPFILSTNGNCLNYITYSDVVSSGYTYSQPNLNSTCDSMPSLTSMQLLIPVLPTLSAWHPSKPTNTVTAPPGPYKPSVVECVIAPNDTAEAIFGNSVPIEHNPAATGLVYQSTSRGNNPTVSPETVEDANAFAVFFAGALNMAGCLFNAGSIF
jgi:hypothetical protein